MGRLSTHVLDVTRGRPAAGMRIELLRLIDGRAELVATATTNSDGRTDQPLLAAADFVAGKYRLQFHVSDYFRSVSDKDAGAFLDIVPVEFVITDANAAFHVPLIVSPWHYVTYRGS
jgi:hydroxyisourate hydrolase